MKIACMVALALAIPTVGATASAPGAAEAKSQKKFCTRVRPKTATRVNQRICMTHDQWREKLGPEWREALTDGDVTPDLEDLELKAKMAQPANPFAPR